MPLQGYNYCEDDLIKDSTDITIIPYSKDHLVYAVNGEELFAVHSEVSWNTVPGVFVTGTVHYEIVNIKPL